MRRRLLLAVSGSFAAALCAGSLAAHGLDIEVRLHPPAVVLRAIYSGAEAVAYASVKVHAPGAAAAEFQSGHADAAGRFAFVPDREGPWRVVVDDELGHREELRIVIDRSFVEAGARTSGGSAAPGAAGAPEMRPSRLPVWLGALVGLALIFGVSGFLYGFKARRPAGS